MYGHKKSPRVWGIGPMFSHVFSLLLETKLRSGTMWLSLLTECGMENSRGIKSKLKYHVALNTGWSAEVLCFHSAIWFLEWSIHVRKSYLTDFCPSLFFWLFISSRQLCWSCAISINCNWQQASPQFWTRRPHKPSFELNIHFKELTIYWNIDRKTDYFNWYLLGTQWSMSFLSGQSFFSAIINLSVSYYNLIEKYHIHVTIGNFIGGLQDC